MNSRTSSRRSLFSRNLALFALCAVMAGCPSVPGGGSGGAGSGGGSSVDLSSVPGTRTVEQAPSAGEVQITTTVTNELELAESQFELFLADRGFLIGVERNGEARTQSETVEVDGNGNVPALDGRFEVRDGCLLYSNYPLFADTVRLPTCIPIGVDGRLITSENQEFTCLRLTEDIVSLECSQDEDGWEQQAVVLYTYSIDGPLSVEVGTDSEMPMQVEIQAGDTLIVTETIQQSLSSG